MTATASATSTDAEQRPDTRAGLPDGHLRAVRYEQSGNSPESHEGAHNTLGSAVLLALVALTVTAIRREQHAS